MYNIIDQNIPVRMNAYWYQLILAPFILLGTVLELLLCVISRSNIYLTYVTYTDEELRNGFITTTEWYKVLKGIIFFFVGILLLLWLLSNTN